MIKSISFLTRQGEHLLGSRREIIHGFIAHTLNTCYECFGLSSLEQSSTASCSREA
jgi:hypothetical protein